ncbi:hypothetical protein V4U86_27575 [Mycobacterium sp. AMU20-3851]|uniref:hypothetical protein n=1 Tax=Mycobacterium sp. AMU20-3851 TaxID=3122055 RepID=UPI0037545E33
MAERTRRVAVVTAATATATALTVGAAAPTPTPRPEEHYLRLVEQPVDLSASVSPFGPPGTYSDITGGAGKTAYNSVQDFIESYERALVRNFNIAGGLGLNLQDLLTAIPAGLLDEVLGAIPIDLSPLLQEVLPNLLVGPLVDLLSLLGITDGAGNVTLSGLLGIVGLDLSDPLNLSGLDIPGIKFVTAGEPFALLKMIAGLDLGWTPGTANAVAEAINSTPYLSVGVEGLLDGILDLADAAVDDIPAVGPLLAVVTNLIDVLTPDLGLDVIDVRVPITIGFGFGAMATGSAYHQVLADLANQPRVGAGGGPLGSLTILPLILANNVGRANGGMLARFYPLFERLGIDIISPDVVTSNRGVGIPVLGTGIELGAGNLVPIKVDATVQYQPYSDFAAWPNPFTLFNNLLAGTIGASYILRGVELDSALDQILGEVGETVADALNLGNPLALNVYLTLATKTLPLLEPLYLAGDVLNMVSFGTLGTIPIRLANALAPALTSLVNLGYTDVVRNPDGTYTRTLDDADTATPFLSFPKVNWGRAMNDVMTSLVNGFHKEFFSGNPTAAPPNVLENLGKLLKTLTRGLNLGGLTAGLQDGIDDLVGGLTGQASRQAANTSRTLAAAAGELPDSEPKLVTLSVQPDGDVSAGKHAAAPDAEIPADSGTAPKHAAPESDSAESEQPAVESEATPDDETAAEEIAAEPGADTDQVTGKPTAKKNPLRNLVRDITKAFAPKKKQQSADGSVDDTDTSDTDKSETKSDTKKPVTKKSETKKSDTEKSETKKADADQPDKAAA